MNKNLFLTVLLWVLGSAAYAQGLGVNADGSAPHTSAMLDVASTSKGVLIPRVALTGTGDVTTIASPETSLLVYNSAVAGTGATAVLPGFYFWSGTAWVRVTAHSDLSSSVWTLNGNGGTSDANFIGTTDNRPLVFKVNNIRAGQLDPIYQNTSWGSGTLAANTTGHDNTASGFGALSSNTTGYDNTASGGGALFRNTTGYHNTASGARALFANTTGYDNTANGYSALSENTTGVLNTASGYSALVSNTTGSRNTASGGEALGFNTTGSYNTANGRAALINNTEGNYNTASGYQALFEHTTGSYNTALGSYAGVPSGSTLTNATAIGAFAQVGGDNALVLGSIKNVNGAPSSVNVGIGTTTPDGSAVLEVTSTERGVLIPRMTAAQRAAITSPATGLLVYQTDSPAGFYYNQGTPATPAWVNLSNANSTWGLSGNAGTDSTKNYIGTTDNRPLVFKVNNTLAGRVSIASPYNTSWGYGALAAITTGKSNTASGFEALTLNTTGMSNTAIGDEALNRNTTGIGNTASGRKALFANTTGDWNTASGASALFLNTGDDNTAFGFAALSSNTTGSNNTALGSYADVAADNLTNATAIGADALVGNSNALVLGSIKGVNSATSSVNVGIGTTAPNASAALEVTSTERGVLISRMTAEQRSAIASPAQGLLVYQTDGTEGFYFYRSTGTPAWVALSVVEPASRTAKDPSASGELARTVQQQLQQNREQQQQINELKKENAELKDKLERLTRAVETLSNHPQKQ